MLKQGDGPFYPEHILTNLTSAQTSCIRTPANDRTWCDKDLKGSTISWYHWVHNPSEHASRLKLCPQCLGNIW